MEGTWGGFRLFCSLKWPHLITISQQFCRRFSLSKGPGPGVYIWLSLWLRNSFFFSFFFFFKSRLLLPWLLRGVFLIIIFILFLIVRFGHGSNQSATTNSDSELISRMETKLLARVTTRGPSRELDQTLRTVYFILSSYSARTDLRSQGRLS